VSTSQRFMTDAARQGGSGTPRARNTFSICTSHAAGVGAGPGLHRVT
jgi:hypothetical protein